MARLVILALLASVAFAKTLAAPDCNDAPPNGLMPDPENCGMFYHCSNGVPYHKECPSGLHFNPTISVCDWPDVAGCVLGEEETATESTAEDPVDCNDAPPSGLMPDPEDCGMFYHCAHGVPYHKECPADLHFNPTLLVCDWQEDAGCVLGEEEISTESLPEEDPVDCDNAPPSGLMPDPEDCSMFYHCAHGVPYHKECPADLHFNPTLLVCDWQQDAGCVLGEEKPATESAPEVPAVNCDDAPPNGLLPDPMDCAMFYQCSNGVPYHMECPADLHFNPSLLVCDWQENAGCVLGEETTPTESVPEKAPVDCDNAPESGLMPDPEDCGKFYHCAHGFPYHKDCPANLHFNPSLLVCDWQDSAGCILGEQTSVTEAAPEESPVDCDNAPYNGLMPDPENCSMFYHCSHGIPYHKECPSNLHFNPELLVCDWQDSAGCVLGEEPTTAKAAAELPPVDCAEAPESGLMADPEDCGKFYQCSNGVPYPMECPTGLHFNPTLEVCDWPQGCVVA